MTATPDLRESAPAAALSAAVALQASAVSTTLSRRKRPEDTAEGCRAHADADLRRAASLTGEHVRWRFEHSAAAWNARADMLGRLEAKFLARAASNRA